MDKIKLSKTERVVIYVILVFFSVLAIFPAFILLSRSFFSLDEITSMGAGLFAKNFTIEAYVQAFTDEGFLIGLKNTFITCLCAVIGVPLTRPTIAAAPGLVLPGSVSEIVFPVTVQPSTVKLVWA